MQKDASVVSHLSICQQCLDLISIPESLNKHLAWQGYSSRARREVMISSSQGCPICTEILHNEQLGLEVENIRKTWVGNVRGDINMATYAFSITSIDADTRLMEKRTSIARIQVRANDRSKDAHDVTQPYDYIFTGGPTIVQFQVYTTSDDPAAEIVPQRPFNTSISGPVAMGAAWECINRCFRDHERCQNATVPLLPTRVLSVGSNSEEKDSLRLHVSLKGQRAEYAALSYCWGGLQTMVTSRETLGSHMKALDLDSLPRSIQDAIKVTRGLKLNYLWIDALCILQDELMDKSHEIENMGEIYKNATVTIAAARSSSANEGFLQEYDPPATIESRIACKSGELGKIWLVPQVDHDLCQEPLATRGWAFQEQILSPRLLHYGSKGLTWHCASERSWPVLPHFVNYSISGARFPRHVAEQIYAQDINQTPSSLSESQKTPQGNVITNYWPEIIEDYSNRSLTFAGDKLLAIAGVAFEMHQIAPGAYYAGIWEHDFIRQLGWKARPPNSALLSMTYKVLPEPPADRKGGYGAYMRNPKALIRNRLATHKKEENLRPISLAIGSCDVPSWSWASTSSPIEFGRIFSADAVFKHCSVKPAIHTSPFGNVTGKELVLEARVIRIKDNAYLKTAPLRVILDSSEGIKDGRVPRVWRRKEGEREKYVWYMLLGYSSRKAPIGLVLAQVHSTDRETFERIGYFEDLDLSAPDTTFISYLDNVQKRRVIIL